jgi:hydrophobic/amphiphilic exporter-1 (mainly G- bacteria), HAE1 family
VADAIRTSVAGDTSTQYREAGVEYDVRIRLREEDRLNPQDIGNIVVGLRNSKPVCLRDVATITEGRSPVQIDHIYGQQYIPVTGLMAVDPTSGKFYPPSVGEQAIRDTMGKMAMPAGITWELGGEGEIRAKSFGYMFEAIELSVILVFVLLCALYESMFYPAIIMAAVPMALSGGLVGLWLIGARVSIMALIGFIMLIGLVTKNSILLVDYTNTMRDRGMARDDALLRSGPTRFRPIMMTTLSLVFALLPIATGIGKGSELRQPMAAAVTGGMLFSTFLTLLVVPALYSIVDDIQNRWYAPLKRLIFGAGNAPDESDGKGPRDDSPRDDGDDEGTELEF